MGINKPSLYAAFGNKEALFIRALNGYINRYGSPHIEVLRRASGSLSARVGAYLKSMSIARMLRDPSLPGGCLVAETTRESGGDCLPAGAVQAVESINPRTRSVLIDFFLQEARADHPEDRHAAEIPADYLLALQFGLAVTARQGDSDVRCIIATACPGLKTGCPPVAPSTNPRWPSRRG